MQRIKLAHTDLSLSQIAFGVWRLTDDDQNTANIRRKIDAALAEGITTFDHADIYGNYECEKLFGKALAEDSSLRSKMELITKCDIALNTDKFPHRRVKYYDTSPAYIKHSVENSLRNLHTDHLDSLLIHRPDPLMNAAETGAVLDELINSGKIKSAGVSNFAVDDWRLLQKHMSNRLVINQIEMSILHKAPFTDGTLSAMQLDELTPMAWSPLASGRLFSNEDSAALRVQPILQRIANEQNSRTDIIAFAWLLKHPANIIPVTGTNNMQRINGLTAAFDIELDRETWFEIWVAANGHEVP